MRVHWVIDKCICNICCVLGGRLYSLLSKVSNRELIRHSIVPTLSCTPPAMEAVKGQEVSGDFVAVRPKWFIVLWLLV